MQAYLDIRTCEFFLCFEAIVFLLDCFMTLCCLGLTLFYATGEVHVGSDKSWIIYLQLTTRRRRMFWTLTMRLFFQRR